MIKTNHVSYEYVRRNEENEVVEVLKAVDNINLTINKGDFIAILGHNGSGKSTLAKHFNALITPTEGSVWIDGNDTQDIDQLWNIRQSAGMVFQNPDNQIIANVVEDDVGFGPENLGVPTKTIWKRVEESLRVVGMKAYAKSSPNRLSGGQKQRVAIAGVMAMRPSCIILDEPTAMLDPEGRRDVIATIKQLNQEENITIVLITHYMEEVIHANRVFVMEKGQVVMDGTPKEIFSRIEELEKYHLTLPQTTLLAERLREKGVPLPSGILTKEELIIELTRLKRKV